MQPDSKIRKFKLRRGRKKKTVIKKYYLIDIKDGIKYYYGGSYWRWTREKEKAWYTGCKEKAKKMRRQNHAKIEKELCEQELKSS